MASNHEAEARELSLIDKVELRIALADSDSKLQNTLNTYLPPLLLKLGSEYAASRNKVIAICQHVNTRIKPRNIHLPVEALLNQFRDHPNSSLIRHFDLLYVQLGFTRLPPSDRADLLTAIVPGISKSSWVSSSHAATLFNLFLKSISGFQFPPKGTSEDTDLRSRLAITRDDGLFLAHWLGKLLLFKISQTNGCPGLSGDENAFLTLQGKPETWDVSSEVGLNLTNAKMTSLRALGSGMFQKEERFFPALYASADPNSRISDTGDDLMKNSVTISSLSDESIDHLYGAYFGVSHTPPHEASSKTSPVASSVRIKILQCLAALGERIRSPDKVVDIVQQDLINQPASLNGERRLDRETTKLRSAVISLLISVARHAKSETSVAISYKVVEALKQFLEQQYSDDRSIEIKTLRGRAFEVVGLLAGVNNDMLRDSGLSILRWLFQCLSEDLDKDVVFSIDSALSSCIRPFQETLSQDVEQALRELLLEAMGSESRNQHNVVYVVLRFANRCLAYNDVVARWINVWALSLESGNNFEIAEEAKKGLDPYWYHLFHQSALTAPDQRNQDNTGASRASFPPFAEIASYLFTQQESPPKSSRLLAHVLSYSRKALFLDCLSSGNINLIFDINWERKLDLTISEDKNARSVIRSSIEKMAHSSQQQDLVLMLWDLSISGLQKEDPLTRNTAVPLLLELCSVLPISMLTMVAPSIKSIQGDMFSNNQDTRRQATMIYGILGSYLGDGHAKSLEDSASALFGQLDNWKSAIGAAANRVNGSVMALSYLASRRGFLRLGDRTSRDTVDHLLPILFQILNESSNDELQATAYEALGQLCLFTVVDCAILSKFKPMETLIDEIARKAKAGNEKVILAMGHISILLDENKNQNEMTKLTEHLRSLHEIRQPETQFTVGEALACTGCAWESKVLLSKLEIDSSPSGPDRSVTLCKLLNQILDDSKTTKPALKKAAVIWLLCMLQFCTGTNEIMGRLKQFQASFKRCLSDRDELIQESASRGLGLVYEKGDRELKDDLVRDLIGSFSSNKADISGTVAEETELFEPGALPTGDSSVTTYKDIMSLASEVGDSSLVYRFMSLASSNAIWSSRAAFGRFGLSNVLSDSSVDGYLAGNPRLYPKLYRYRFDPFPNVRKSMNDIWTALVKDTAKILETHFDSILEDLLTSIVSGRDWRARQASCAAIAELIQGRMLEQIQQYLDRIWSLCFKVLDDIKQSVRAAAAELARVLTNILLRKLESSSGDSAVIGGMLRGVLPFLLSTSGIESSAKDVQALSLYTLTQIIKKGRASLLRPFVSELVERLLGLLSTLEPEAVNYVHLNAANYNLKQQDIDDMRLKSITTSPIMQAIENCLDFLDEETMSSLVQPLQNALKTAVGVPTKVGFSRVLVTLSTRRNYVFRPHADKFLIMLEKRILDRNDTVSSSYAVAMGYVARCATEMQVFRLAKFAQELYFSSDEDRPRIVSGDLVQSVAKHAKDKFDSLAAEYLPFIYMARNDDNPKVQTVFRETWDENVGGLRAVLLYLQEIVALANSHFSSKRWILKHAAALSVADATKAVEKSQGCVGEAECDILWPALKTALAEKSWEGKEHVLEAFALFAEKGKTYWSSHAEVERDMKQIALREARRRNAAYQGKALKCLARVVGTRKGPDMSDDAMDIAGGVIEEVCAADDDEMEVDGGRSEAKYKHAGAGQLRTRNKTWRRMQVEIAEDMRLGESRLTESHVDVMDRHDRQRMNGATEALFGAVRLHMHLLDACHRSAALGERSSLDWDPPTLPARRVLGLLHLAAAHADSQASSIIFASARDCLRSLSRLPCDPARIAVAFQGASCVDVCAAFADILLPHSTTLLHLHEALRLQRAEALLAVAETASTYGLDLPLPERLVALESEEKSPAAKHQLMQAQRLWPTANAKPRHDTR